ncbi:hypothetical protein SVAN01_08413 [Stagonosporopsis vannaccii]|nr:hypothetical protein SVAN01_08413 [Stagonosporopsis vannaccii]
MGGSAVDEDDQHGDGPLAASRYPSCRSDVAADGAASRLSFSSLYSIGSALYANTRGPSRSARSSVVGSEPDGAPARRAPRRAPR